MKYSVKILILMVFIILGGLLESYNIYLQFQDEQAVNQRALDGLDPRFVEVEKEGNLVIELDALRYTDVTFLDLSINIANPTDQRVVLRNSVVTFFFEDVFAINKTLGNIEVEPKGDRVLDFTSLSFSSEVIDKALKGQSKTLKDYTQIKGVLSTEYDFSPNDIYLWSYSLNTSFTGKVLLREIFGGKSQEEATIDILGLNRSSSLI